MLIKKLEKKITGAPVKVGTSNGGMHAFMVGTCYVRFKGQSYERPVVFLDPSLDSKFIPGLDQLMTIDQLIKFSQPKSWEFDAMMIAQVEQQLKDLASSGTADREMSEPSSSSPPKSADPSSEKPEERNPAVR